LKGFHTLLNNDGERAMGYSTFDFTTFPLNCWPCFQTDFGLQMKPGNIPDFIVPTLAEGE